MLLTFQFAQKGGSRRTATAKRMPPVVAYRIDDGAQRRLHIRNRIRPVSAGRIQLFAGAAISREGDRWAEGWKYNYERTATDGRSRTGQVACISSRNASCFPHFQCIISRRAWLVLVVRMLDRCFASVCFRAIRRHVCVRIIANCSYRPRCECESS